MSAEHARRSFTLRELFVVVAIIGMLCALAAPAIQRARENGRRDQCAFKLKLLGEGLHAHHNVFRKFPAVSNQSNPDGNANVGIMPGSGTSRTNAGFMTSPGSASGYSWIVAILPFIDEAELYNQISVASEKLTLEAWSNAPEYQVPLGGVERHFSTLPLDTVLCPSFKGSPVSTACTGVSSIPAAVTPYSLPKTGYGAFNSPSSSPPFGVAITNYVALSATTSLNMPDGFTADGGIIPGRGTSKQGILFRNTLVICETKEPAFNSWYDGTTAWTTATPAGTELATVAGEYGNYIGVRVGGVTSLNYGPWPIPSNGAANLYAPSGYTTAGFSGQSGSIAWGPSSDHAGGVVMHLSANGAVHAIKDDIDPTLYVQLVTRQGGELVKIPASE